MKRQIMKRLRHLLPLLLTLAAALSPAAEAAPLKPGAPFDYSKFAFQPKSWEKKASASN